MNDSQFLDNFKGSTVANVVSAGVFLIFYIVREKCKHSKCEGNSFCCRFKCKDDEDGDEGSPTRSEQGEDGQKNFRFPRKAEKKMHKLHVRIDKGVHEEHPSVVPSDGRGRCSVDTRLAEKKRDV